MYIMSQTIWKSIIIIYGKMYDTYIHIEKISINITSVGQAEVSPNNALSTVSH